MITTVSSPPAQADLNDDSDCDCDSNCGCEYDDEFDDVECFIGDDVMVIMSWMNSSLFYPYKFIIFSLYVLTAWLFV